MKNYKNLLLAENGVLFNTTTKKIFFLDEEHIEEFDKQKFLRQREKFIRSCSKNENKKCSFCPIKWHCTKCTIKINNHSFDHREVLKAEEFKRFDRIAEIIEEGKIEQYIHKLEGAYKYV